MWVRMYVLSLEPSGLGSRLACARESGGHAPLPRKFLKFRYSETAFGSNFSAKLSIK